MGEVLRERKVWWNAVIRTKTAEPDHSVVLCVAAVARGGDTCPKLSDAITREDVVEFLRNCRGANSRMVDVVPADVYGERKLQKHDLVNLVFPAVPACPILEVMVFHRSSCSGR